jgi:RNA polymerase sigma factor (sigma-70 family)
MGADRPRACGGRDVGITLECMKALELLSEIRQGHMVQECQAKLYVKVRALLLPRIEWKMTAKVRPRLDPEDVLDEAFLRGMSALDLFRGTTEKAFFAWMYTIAKHVLLDQSRRRSLAALRFAAAEGDPGPRPSQVRDSRGRAESMALRQDWLESLLGQLKEKEARVIRLHKLQGLSFEEIAEKWRSTPGAVQRFYSRAWQKLTELKGRRPSP